MLLSREPFSGLSVVNLWPLHLIPLATIAWLTFSNNLLSPLSSLRVSGTALGLGGHQRLLKRLPHSVFLLYEME